MSILFNAAAIKHAPWSMSKASVALSCPFRHRLKYIEHIKGKEAIAGSAARIGSAAHEAIEWVLKGKYDLKEALRRTVIKTALTSPEMDDVFALAYSLQAFLERLNKFKKKYEVNEQKVELRFGLTADFEKVPFFDKSGRLFFRGVWDLCLRVQDDQLVIIDHKSGQVKDISEYHDQLSMYALAGLSIFPGITKVHVALNFMQDATGLHWGTPQSAQEVRENALPWFVAHLNKAGESAEQNTARKGYWCSFCEYTKMCPLNT